MGSLGPGLRLFTSVVLIAAAVVVTPIAGVASMGVGARPILVAGLRLMAVGLAWLAGVTPVTVAYMSLLPAFVVSGIGMGLFFAPIANVVLSAVPKEDEGKASGANNTIRELGGVFGVAVLAAIFSENGSYAAPQTYVDGIIPAIAAGAAVVAAVAALATGLPRLASSARSIEPNQVGIITEEGAAAFAA